jgi:hypothetical protein
MTDKPYQNAEDVKGLQQHLVVLTEEEKRTVSQIIERLPPLDVRRVDNETLPVSIRHALHDIPSTALSPLYLYRLFPSSFL